MSYSQPTTPRRLGALRIVAYALLAAIAAVPLMIAVIVSIMGARQR